LQKGTDYWFWVGAHNVDGTGSLGQSVEGVTQTTVPSSVSSVSVGEATATTVKLTWAAPSDNGGLTIDGYTIYKRESFEDPTEADIIAEIEGNVFSFTCTNLIHGKTYYFWVSANNVDEKLCLPVTLLLWAHLRGGS